jgi:anti-sigma B factor antagonist
VNANADAHRLQLKRTDSGDDTDRWVLVGELDSHSADLVRQTVSSDSARVVLDMASVSFIDSSGLRALVELHTAVGEGGGSLRIEDPSDAVRRVIELTGLAGHLGVE